jgi:hypothetical protein
MTELKRSKKQIHFWIDEAIFDNWNKFRQQAGYADMTDFIVTCVQDKMYPIPVAGVNQDLTRQIGELKQTRDILDAEIKDLIGLRTNKVITSTPFSDPELEAQTIDFLHRSGPTNEYYIAKQLNIQSSQAFQICTKLFRESKILQDTRGNWYVSK